MEKPHEKSTLKYMKQYVRAHKLNHPEVKLSMKKAEMAAALRKIGHMSGSAPKKAEKAFPIGQKFGSKKFTKAAKPKSKLDQGQKDFLAGIKDKKPKKKKSKSKLDAGQKSFLAGIY